MKLKYFLQIKWYSKIRNSNVSEIINNQYYQFIPLDGSTKSQLNLRIMQKYESVVLKFNVKMIL